MKKILLITLAVLSALILISCTTKNDNMEEFTLKGIIKNVTNDRVEIEVIESDYAFGIYWVLTSNNTDYFDTDGGKITRGDLKENDTVQVSYSGQTMMSYPPQIVAYSITKL